MNKVLRSKRWPSVCAMYLLLTGAAVSITNLHSEEPASVLVQFQSDDKLAIDSNNEGQKITWKECDGKDVMAEGVVFYSGKGMPRLLLDNTSVFLGKEERIGTESSGHLVRITGKFVRRTFGSDDSTRQGYSRAIGYFIDVDKMEIIQRVKSFPIVVRSQ